MRNYKINCKEKYCWYLNKNHNPAYDFCDDEGPADRCQDLTSLLFREGVERLELEPLRLGGRSDLMLPIPTFSPFSRMSPGCSPLGCGDDGSCEKPLLEEEYTSLNSYQGFVNASLVFNTNCKQ